MSRIGKQPISIPDKVSVKIGADRKILVEGPKGKLNFLLPDGIDVKQEEKALKVGRASDHRTMRSLHGTAQRLLSNMIHGVSQGYKRELEIQGVGFKAAVKGKNLDLSLGYSHPLLHPIPDGLKVTVNENTQILVEGIDKQLVGQFAADVRGYYPPEPYKGKGVRYKDEQIRRKEGKTVK